MKIFTCPSGVIFFIVLSIFGFPLQGKEDIAEFLKPGKFIDGYQDEKRGAEMPVPFFSDRDCLFKPDGRIIIETLPISLSDRTEEMIDLIEKIDLETKGVKSYGENRHQDRDKGLDSFVDLAGLKKTGDEWKVISQDLNPQEGQIKLHQAKWLMYFLHWRPLTEANKTLSLEYVRNHMLNFWGQAMNFELKNIEGEIEIEGHKGFYTEGTVMDGAVYTRFIVWNCPQTGRQFTADCNINLRRKTPRDLLEIQKFIAQTVCCHKDCSPAPPPPQLTKKYQSRKWNLSFHVPANWKVADYPSAEWFPEGMSEHKGSLWTLLTDSEKHVELLWEEKKDPLSAELFKQFLDRVSTRTSYEDKIITISDVKLTSSQRKNGYFIGEGTFSFKIALKEKEQISDYVYKALLWKENKKVFFLLTSMIKIKKFWDIENDLTPSPEVLMTFLKNEILPNIKVYNAPKVIENKD